MLLVEIVRVAALKILRSLKVSAVSSLVQGPLLVLSLLCLLCELIPKQHRGSFLID